MIYLSKPQIAPNHSSKDTTKLVLRGTLLLVVIFIIYIAAFLFTGDPSRTERYLWIIVSAIVYLLFGEYLVRKKYYQFTNWILILFFEALALVTLLAWGLNTPIGILSLGFAALLPSILIGPRAVLPVLIISMGILVAVHIIHTVNLVTPDTPHLARPSSPGSIITYATILSVFAVISWISSSQRERTLITALRAEARLHAQKDELKNELAKESATLRQSQLRQMRDLHKFAFLGQSAAATLHELSNHLSVLNLDIDDLSQQTENSMAIQNAKESIEHINKMVRKVKHQINSHDKSEPFDAIEVVEQSINDMELKCADRRIKLSATYSSMRSFKVTGDPMALMQIITILLNNAIDACYDIPNPSITVAVRARIKLLEISVSDTGPGVDPVLRNKLFSPVASTKPTGMGIGLYIARHLIQNQFRGNISLLDTEFGATFVISIPR